MRKKLPNLVAVAIVTTITIFAWIFFDLYRVLNKPKQVDVSPDILAPVAPELNIKALEKIENSISINDSELSQLLLNNNSQTPTPTVTESPANETEIATNEADIIIQATPTLGQ